MATGSKAVGEYGAEVARLLNARKGEVGISLRAMERACGVEQSQISRMLRGLKPMTVDEFMAICGVLSVTPSAVLRVVDAHLGITRPPLQVEDLDVPDVDAAAALRGYDPSIDDEQP